MTLEKLAKVMPCLPRASVVMASEAYRAVSPLNDYG